MVDKRTRKRSGGAGSGRAAALSRLGAGGPSAEAGSSAGGTPSWRSLRRLASPVLFVPLLAHLVLLLGWGTWAAGCGDLIQAMPGSGEGMEMSEAVGGGGEGRRRHRRAACRWGCVELAAATERSALPRLLGWSLGAPVHPPICPGDAGGEVGQPPPGAAAPAGGKSWENPVSAYFRLRREEGVQRCADRIAEEGDAKTVRDLVARHRERVRRMERGEAGEVEQGEVEEGEIEEGQCEEGQCPLQCEEVEGGVDEGEVDEGEDGDGEDGVGDDGVGEDGEDALEMLQEAPDVLEAQQQQEGYRQHQDGQGGRQPSRGQPIGVQQRLHEEGDPQGPSAAVLDHLKATVEYMGFNPELTEWSEPGWGQGAAGGGRCANGHEMCTVWAVLGECVKNAAFMASTCGPACRLCHLTEAERQELGRRRGGNEDDENDEDDEDDDDDEEDNLMHDSLARQYGCDFGAERPVHGPETWAAMRLAYVETVGPRRSTLEGDDALDGASTAFRVPFEVRQSPGMGRGLFATEAVGAGLVMYDFSRTAQFWEAEEFTMFLSAIGTELACDVLMWSYVQELGGTEAGGASGSPGPEATSASSDLRIMTDLDPGSFCNNGDGGAGGNMGWRAAGGGPSPAPLPASDGTARADTVKSAPLIALRDIEAGEEILCSYGQFSEGEWSHFGL